MSSRSSRSTTSRAATEPGSGGDEHGSGRVRPLWDAAAYARFVDERLRPALDLIGCIPDVEPEHIVDLGCGPGGVTRSLAQRWRQARVTGIDASADMLAAARRDGGEIRWLQGDLADWVPDAQPDLIFSNAALHWLDDHRALFPRLLAMLADGGVLAVQMPNNFAAPSHQAIFELAVREQWRERLAPLLRASPVASAETYLEMLLPQRARVDLWETTYWHALD
ncbi:MAG TPA: methyltransferase domain-containing protein, partial [Rhodospirillales bacterium]|nr:methyltransferase domain-containing protein [Rhodospirillales bacterium]